VKEGIALILDPRGIIASGGLDVLERHISYGKSLNSLSKNYRLMVFTAEKKILPDSRENIYLDKYSLCSPTLNSVKFAWKAFRLISRNSLDVQLLIAGDPWESFLSALILKRLMRRNIAIQVQLHADIADPLWRKLSVPNRVRYLVSKILLPYSSSIRAVSVHQSKNLINNMKVPRSKIQVIPVPINLDWIEYPILKDKVRIKSIALVGRIHSDRGIWEFVDLIEKLANTSKDLKVILIGAIEQESNFLKRLRFLVPESSLIVLGQLTEKDLSGYWKRIGVLVSLAPVESYGRVLREALLSGVPVWALKTSGAKDLASQCRNGQLKFINLADPAIKLAKDFEELLKVKPDLEFRKDFISQNKLLPELLAKSWVKLLKD
jgi:glycosyltransferase involved in cell wall biosynthesis